jgi:hypothetical protein
LSKNEERRKTRNGDGVEPEQLSAARWRPGEPSRGRRKGRRGARDADPDGWRRIKGAVREWQEEGLGGSKRPWGGGVDPRLG